MEGETNYKITAAITKREKETKEYHRANL